LIIYSLAESNENNNMQIKDVPETNLNNALVLFNEFPKKHTVSDQNAGEFWKILIYQIKKRENEREKFENKPQNLNKTKKQLIQEFDQQNPKILEKIADLWNKILDPAGLEFDLENASNPIQLNDNLKAYIRLKSTKERINYNQLSTGIRNFMFRLGHIYSLYFNREVKNGFLLIDEPENSLFPDFLIELVDTYLDIIKDKNDENNTQFFVSTHSPIIAAQFEPYERIILEWNEKGAVDAYKGEAPAGDDPNDILSKDFKMRNLMGKKGQQMWKEYVALRNKLIHTSDEKKKTELISKINKIGELYNFEV
ncbi:MAG: AAA family ATPase, partial [Bacteroidales bacterium]|nr:AAA family ATPase [Bacteroidales bacterium]